MRDTSRESDANVERRVHRLFVAPRKRHKTPQVRTKYNRTAILRKSVLFMLSDSLDALVEPEAFRCRTRLGFSCVIHHLFRVAIALDVPDRDCDMFGLALSVSKEALSTFVIAALRGYPFRAQRNVGVPSLSLREITDRIHGRRQFLSAETKVKLYLEGPALFRTAGTGTHLVIFKDARLVVSRRARSLLVGGLSLLQLRREQPFLCG